MVAVTVLLRCAQATINVQNAVVCKLIRGKKQGRVGHLRWVRDSVEGSVFEICLLEFWLESYKKNDTTGLYISNMKENCITPRMSFRGSLGNAGKL